MTGVLSEKARAAYSDLSGLLAALVASRPAGPKEKCRLKYLHSYCPVRSRTRTQYSPFLTTSIEGLIRTQNQDAGLNLYDNPQQHMQIQQQGLYENFQFQIHIRFQSEIRNLNLMN